MARQYHTFTTDRLAVRPTSHDDAAFLLRLMNSPTWIANIGDRKVHSLEDAKAYITERMQPQLERLGFSNNTLIRKSDGVKVGTCGLYDRAGIEGVDIGYALLPAYEKMGYAYESTVKLTAIAFEQFKLSKISAITLASNLPSQQLLKKLEFTFSKMIRIPNDPEELMLFELFKPQ